MKKQLLLFLSVFYCGISFSQQHARLIAHLDSVAEHNQNRFTAYLSSATRRLSEEEIKKTRSLLAGFAGDIPVFWTSEDARANRSSNITPLQNGLPALSNTQINGTGINILVMDEKRVFESHNEFGGPTNGPNRITNMEASSLGYGNHATAVSSIIAAAGNNNNVKGVLPNATIKSYDFSTTALGTNYKKLADASPNISNHSYGINVGWAFVDTTNTTFPQVGYYWIGNYGLNTLDTYSGTYDTEDRDFDKIVYTDPQQIIIKSAGNNYGTHPNNNTSRPKFKYNNTTRTFVPFEPNDTLPDPNCSRGFNCIGPGSLAKNIIVVGAANQLSTTNNLYTTSGDVVKASYSSAGPRKDGAVKPDITAVGSSIAFASFTNASTFDSYASGNGTSFAAPVITGITGALTQVNRILTGNNSFSFKADEMKALLTHTANEAGNPGPDVWFGWGFADAQNAAQLLIDKKNFSAYFERNTINNTTSTTFTLNVTAKSGEPLKATISWIDPAAVPFTNDNDNQNNTTSRLVNDLDLRITDPVTNTVYTPWKLDVSNPMANATTGDNTVDNIEQVVVNNPVAGRTYRIEVTKKGTLKDDFDLPAPQPYALIVTGLQTGSLSTSSTKEQNPITVFPTQTKDFVNVLIPRGAKTIEAYDLSGKKVLNVAAKSFQTLDLSALPKGVYLIIVKTEEGSTTKKVIRE